MSKKKQEVWYNTDGFGEHLIEAIKEHIVNNRVKKLPFKFLLNYPQYRGHASAKVFYDNGWRYLSVKNDKLMLTWHSEYLKKDFTDIVSETYHRESGYYFIHTADLVRLVEVVYDTIGSSYFKGSDTIRLSSKEIDDLEQEYEERRNEV